MPRTAITDRPIHVYMCLNDPSQQPVAIIQGFPMMFKGKTPMRASKLADEWRKEAVRGDKLMSKAHKAKLLGEVVA